ncbi:MAG: hypothetical protein M1274_07925 [Actinobacteria bacterium]|nr:hypothetical protein [Actinomycetota bacterium]
MTDIRITVVLFVSQVSTLIARPLAYGSSLAADRFEAVTVSSDSAATQRLRKDWAALGIDVPLVIIWSEGGEFLRPAIKYVRSLRPAADHSVLVLIPELVARHWYETILHNHAGALLMAALWEIPWVIVVSIPVRLDAKPNSQDSE